MNKTLRNLALVALAAAPFSAFAEIAGSGTQADPYQIASKEDLCNAQSKCTNEVNYFIQTADIDMAGVEEYIPINTVGNNWSRTIYYDGQNHLIKNFGPKWHKDGEGNGGYYVTSIFGVVNGWVKNLGVVDANLNTAGARQRAGILCGYAGSSASTKDKTVTFENVYVTGTVRGGNRNTGGLAGINQLPVTIKNCFVNLDMSCEASADGNGMLIGEATNTVTVQTSYIAGKVGGVCNYTFGKGGDKATFDGFVMFAEAADGANIALGFNNEDGYITIANTAADKADGIEEVQGWEAFSKTEEVGGYPALASFASSTTPGGIVGSGTEEDPYQIATKEDLCNAQSKCTNEVNYFIQTADIDMAGVEEYIPINTVGNNWSRTIYYDGQNHLIKNFGPKWHKDGEGNGGYYVTSIFGVVNGWVKNLGVVDANLNTAGARQRAGILCGYAGSSASTKDKTVTFENVYVTGTVRGGNRNTGGLAGINQLPVTIKNCFVNLDMSCEASADGNGMLIGEATNTVTVQTSYIAGKVGGVCNYTFGKGGDKATFDCFVMFAEPAEGANIALGVANANGEVMMANTADTKVDGIDEVQTWFAFDEEKMYLGYPALNWQNTEVGGINDIVVDNATDAPAVYYNLQGVQVANPSNGIYIVRQGNKVSKQYIRK